MPVQKPAGLDEAVKPFVALRHVWSLQDIPGSQQPAIADSTQLRRMIGDLPFPTVGDVRTLLRVLESTYGEFKLDEHHTGSTAPPAGS